MRQRNATILKALLPLAAFCSLLVAAALIPIAHAQGGSEPMGEWQFIGRPLGDTHLNRVVVDPEDENLWYVGTFDNGLYVTHDGGKTWEHQISGNIGAIKIDPNNHNTVYASSNSDLYRSEAQGDNFTLVFSSTDPVHPGLFIESMLVSSWDGSIFLGFCGTSTDNSTILKSKSSDPRDGWDISFVAPQVDFYFWHLWDIEEDPINGYLYFCTEILGTQGTYTHKNPVMRSTDRGKLWEDISPLEGTAMPHGLSIQVNPLTQAVYYLSETRALFTSFDFGHSWQPWKEVPVNNALIIDKNHPNRFYGTQIPSELNAGAVYFSDDIGKSFTSIGLENKNSEIALNGTGTRLVAINKDGVYAMNIGVSFPDPNLEAAVREAIGKPSGEIQQSDLANLTGLAAGWRSISDLSGLEWCTSLQWLFLENNQISDISPLQSLTKLLNLRLWNNNVLDISPLSSLSSLRFLSIVQNQIEDLAPLAGLSNLQWLSASSNQITNVLPLSSLTGLTILSLDSNLIADISPLSSLTSLWWLFLGGNQISDISPLQGLASMQWLDLRHNQISVVGPLSGLANVESLLLSNNQIEDVEPLVANAWLGPVSVDLTNNPLSAASLGIYMPQLKSSPSVIEVLYDDPVVTFPDPGLNDAVRAAPEVDKPSPDLIHQSDLAWLTELSVHDANTDNLSGLQYCTSLTSLHLSNNRIIEISPLEGLTSLTDLNLAGNQVIDIMPVQGLTSLTDLNLAGNQVYDISPLEGLTSLTDLNLAGNQVINILPLAGLTSLTQLDLAGNQVYNLTPLQGLTNLTTLDLKDNQVVSIPNLSDLKSLTQLNLAGNQVSVISPLAGLTSLTELNLAGNQVNNIFYLSGLTSLTELNLAGNQIGDISWLKGLTNLTALNLEGNYVQYIGYLSGLTSLTDLNLAGNKIRDVKPLVDNPGIGDGDTVDVTLNPLDGASLGTYMRTLLSRGVQISYDAALEATFLDPNLGQAIRDTLNIPCPQKIFKTDLSRLTSLYARSRGIGDLDGLEYCNSLTLLELGDNHIEDISPLEGLTNLFYLYLDSNQINNISPLSGLHNLAMLNLSSNQISDISALVSNSGIGQNDTVVLYNNPLDLWEGSQDLTDIKTLEDRGVHVYHDEPLIIMTGCPVDLEVRDPDGLVINKTSNQIPLATYVEKDLDGDGDIEDMVTIMHPKLGGYQVTVIPEPGAPSTATFSLLMTAHDTTITLADNVKIADIPSQPYAMELREDGMIDVAPIVGVITAPLDPIQVNSVIDLAATFTDPDETHAHASLWDWGDGTTSEGMINETDGSGIVTGSHSYATVGIYTVSLTVTDHDGLTGTSTLRIQVIQKYAIWANASDGKAIQWSGSGAQITGKVHSNGGITMTGSNNAINGIVYYVSNLAITGSSDHYTLSQKTSPRPMPVHYDLSAYKPGGTAAQAAGKYQCINGNFNVSKSGSVLDGLYYVKGNVSLSGSNIKGTFTIVAEGTISISGSGLNCTPYSGDLLFFSNGASLSISGSNSILGGIIYVPKGQINISGSGSKISGCLFGDRIALSGSNTKITVR